ncbi:MULTISPECIES: MFS transporter [unclassified Halomonas]|uniref:MFS transporter n=1 Tax=unclassified Halomonas TaxID=2609666 RepID=UPI00207693D4|nr:MFS transporter [Halomonas sp. S3-1-8]
MRLWILIASTSAFFNLYQLQALYPWLAARFEATLTQAGWLNMATLLGMMLTAPFASRLTRRLPPTRAILVGLTVLIILNALLAVSASLATVWLVRLAQGVALPCVLTACVALLAGAQSERQRTVWVGYFVAGTVLGSTLSRFYPAWAVESLGWAGGFISAAGLLALAWLLITWQSRRRALPVARPAAAPPFTVLLKASLAEQKLTVAFCIGFTLLFTQSAVFTVLGLRLAEAPFHQSAAQIGLVYLMSLPAIIAVIASPRLYRNRREGPFFLPFIGLLWASLALAKPSYASILASVAGFSLSTYLLQTLTTRLVSKAERVPASFASGLYLCCYYAGGALGAVLAAACFSRWGWAGALWLIGSAHITASLLVLWLYRRANP